MSKVAESFYKDPSLLQLYSEDIKFDCVSTGSGANGKQELIWFFKQTTFAEDWQSMARVKVIKHTDMDGMMVDECVYEIEMKENESNRLQWMLPGLKLVNPGDSKTIYVPIVTIIEYTSQITHVRVYWDQACILKQIGFLYQVQPKQNTFQTAPNFQIPVLGASQSEKLVTSQELNFFQKNLLQEPQHMEKPMDHNVIVEEVHSTPVAIRQKKESPFKQKDNMKSYFEGKEETDWLPKSKGAQVYSKSTVFDDTPMAHFGNTKINPQKNTSHFNLSHTQYGNEQVGHRSGKQQNIHKNDSHFSLQHTQVQNSPHVVKENEKNKSHFNIADSGKMDDKPVYHGRARYIANQSSFNFGDMDPVVEQMKKTKIAPGGKSNITFG